MPEELPQFSSQPLGGEKPKRRPVRRRAVSQTRSRRASPAPRLNEKVESQLSSIYRDDHGRLPDMGRIKIQGQRSAVKTFFGIIILGGFLAAAAWAGFFLLPTANKMSENQVKLTITGPEEVALGSTNSYKITFENLQNVKLNNATLTVYFPEGFSFIESSFPSQNIGHTEWDLGIIGAKKKGELVITGKNYGALNKETSWRVLLNYQPENFNSMLQKITNFTTVINQSPIKITVTGPEKVAIGNEVEYTFKTQASNDFAATTMELTPIWPANFHVSTSTPAMKKSSWSISSTTPEMIFKAKGQFNDSPDSSSTSTSEIKASLFLLPAGSNQKFEVANTSLQTAVIKNALNLNLAVNGSLNNLSFKPGGMLNLTLNTKNASSETVNKAAVKLTIEAPSVQKQSILDWTNLQDTNDGTVKGEQVNDDLRRGIIIWDSKQIASLNELKANDEVNIDLGLPIKGADKFDLSSAKTYQVQLEAEMTFLDINGKTQTIKSNPVTVTLDSDLTFSSEHTVATADNKDTHSIVWKLNNNFHPLKNLKVTADLYGDIAWQEPASIPAGELKFDPQTKKIVWTVAQMPESLDVIALPLKITLNKKDPTQNTLMSKVKITADDTVTGESIEITGDEISLKN